MLTASFYSYKGGSGRSTTAWNTIQRLVDKMNPTEEEPFVIVDTDVDSAGATFLYEAKDDFYGKNDGKRQLSVQARMVKKDPTNYNNASASVKSEFFDKMLPIGKFFGLPKDKYNVVRLIGANLDKEHLSSIGAHIATAGDTQMDNLTNNITNACEACGAKALFFDTPSGTQFFAQWSIKESKAIVCCMRPTLQFRNGTFGVLTYYIKDDMVAEEQRTYILTPTAVCIDPNQRFGKGKDGNSLLYPKHAFDLIKEQFSGDNIMEKDFEEAFKNSVNLDMLEPAEGPDLIFGIPEIKRFKWQEGCLGVIKDKGEEELSRDDVVGLARYDLLAKTIKTYGE